MCTDCGCSAPALQIERMDPPGVRAPFTPLLKTHHHAHVHGDDHTHAAEQVDHLEHALLQRNDAEADSNRRWFQQLNVLALNLLSSPGAGKTTLLEKTLLALQGERPLAVIEGDQATARDADRIAATGVKVVQVNTGTGCHLDASMIHRAAHQLEPLDNHLLLIENVGNLVCPALFDLGEHKKVVLLSVTEGDDKPLKYPHMFQAADLLLITKLDLLPYVEFDVERCLAAARQLNPRIESIQLSARAGTGMDAWLQWVRQQSGAA
jgi:hydrogenase nickel incorporation protein HypB